MKQYSDGERYDLIAEMYQDRYGEMAPGKDRPAAMGAQSDADMIQNNKQFREYINGDLIHDDCCDMILNQQRMMERLENETEKTHALAALVVKPDGSEGELVEALEVTCNSMCAHCTTPARCPGECLTYFDAQQTLAHAREVIKEAENEK